MSQVMNAVLGVAAVQVPSQKKVVNVISTIIFSDGSSMVQSEKPLMQLAPTQKFWRDSTGELILLEDTVPVSIAPPVQQVVQQQPAAMPQATPIQQKPAVATPPVQPQTNAEPAKPSKRGGFRGRKRSNHGQQGDQYETLCHLPLADCLGECMYQPLDDSRKPIRVAILSKDVATHGKNKGKEMYTLIWIAKENAEFENEDGSKTGIVPAAIYTRKIGSKNTPLRVPHDSPAITNIVWF